MTALLAVQLLFDGAHALLQLLDHLAAGLHRVLLGLVHPNLAQMNGVVSRSADQSPSRYSCYRHICIESNSCSLGIVILLMSEVVFESKKVYFSIFNELLFILYRNICSMFHS